MPTVRERSDDGLLSLQVLAAVIAVVAVVSAILVAGFPERIACEIEGTVGSVTSEAVDDECDADDSRPAAADGPVTDGPVTDRPGTDLASDDGVGGLTAKTYAAGAASSSGAAITTGADLLDRALDQRCLPSLAHRIPSLICLSGADFSLDGTDVLERCVAGEGPGSLACRSTDADHDATLTIGPNTTAWCQPMRFNGNGGFPGTDVSSMPVQWACAGTAGEVHFCDSDVPREAIATENVGPSRDTYELANWHTQQRFWPTTCDSRTLFDRTWAGCPQITADQHVQCAVPSFRNAPARPISCLEFFDAATPSSHTLNKPLHCVSGSRTLTEAPESPQTCDTALTNPGRQLTRAGGGSRGRWFLESLFCSHQPGTQLIVAGGGAVADGVLAPGAQVPMADVQLGTAHHEFPLVSQNPAAVALVDTLEDLEIAGQNLGDPIQFLTGLPIWITALLPAGVHQVPGADQQFIVIPPDGVDDHILVAWAILQAGDPIPDPIPGRGVSVTEHHAVVDALLLAMAQAWGTDAAGGPEIPPTQLEMPGPGDFALINGPGDGVDAVWSALTDLPPRFDGLTVQGTTINSVRRQQRLLLNLLASVRQTSSIAGWSYQQLHSTLRYYAMRHGLDPALIDEAFIDAGGADIVAPVCRKRPRDGGDDDPGRPGPGGADGGLDGLGGGLCVSVP